MSFVRESVTIGDKEISIETGKWAKQASGAVIVRCGSTMVLVTANGSQSPRQGMDFMPLTCEYKEKTYAAGKIPGSFFRREGRPSTDEILVCRLMDRPMRPLFPKSWRIDTQLIANVVSFDKINPTDVLAMTGASAALHISDLVWNGPVVGIRVGRIDGEFIAYPTFEQREKSDIDMIIAVSRDAIVMVEGGMKQISESVIIDALMFGHEAAQPLIDLQEKLRAAVGREKRVHVEPTVDEELHSTVKDAVWDKLGDAMAVREKHARSAAVRAVRNDAKATLCAEGAAYEGREKDVGDAFDKAKKKWARKATIETKARIDGRGYDEIRNISCEVGILPEVHGSALFQRGETQALVTSTLGTRFDELRVDALTGNSRKQFYLHYNFPPYSVGETRRIMGPGRREIGHGMLAERSLTSVMPSRESFPYTIRVVSDITESNGSSSMASVCGGCLSMMLAGVPLSQPVAGIAMGLVSEGDSYEILSDILGSEDHCGDMDFKVAGSGVGITALQMDIKITGVSRELLSNALERARLGRIHILRKMLEAVPAPSAEVSEYAPRMETIKIPSDRIGFLIGPGGKNIRQMQADYEVRISIVDDEGNVQIYGTNAGKVKKCRGAISATMETPEVGSRYNGTVKSVRDFGAFIEILPGVEALCHISELGEGFIESVTDVVNVGDELDVIIINVDDRGKIKVSHKATLEGAEGGDDAKDGDDGGREERPRRERSEGDDDDRGSRRPRRSRRRSSSR